MPFNAQDLASNKMGKISTHQLETLKVTLENNNKLGKKIMSGVMIVSIIALASQMFQNKELQAHWFYILPGFVAMFSIYYFWYQHYMDHTTKKVLEGNVPVEAVMGKVTLQANKVSGKSINMVQAHVDEDISTSYTIKIQEKTLYVDQETFSAFEDGKDYAIFYIKYSGPVPMVISWEKLV